MAIKDSVSKYMFAVPVPVKGLGENEWAVMLEFECPEDIRPAGRNVRPAGRTVSAGALSSAVLASVLTASTQPTPPKSQINEGSGSTLTGAGKCLGPREPS